MVVFTDKRAALGGCAMLLVGTYLTVLLAFYFFPPADFRLLQARWWLDATFYLQIFCYALMWIAHRKRIHRARGWRRRRAIWRMMIGLAGVSMPGLVLVLSVTYDWFRAPPEQAVFIHYSSILFIGWVLVDYLLPLMASRFAGVGRMVHLSPPSASGTVQLLTLLPLLLLILIAAVEIPRGGVYHYIFWPLLIYGHRSVSYFSTAISVETARRGGWA